MSEKHTFTLTIVFWKQALKKNLLTAIIYLIAYSDASIWDIVTKHVCWEKGFINLLFKSGQEERCSKDVPFFAFIHFIISKLRAFFSSSNSLLGWKGNAYRESFEKAYLGLYQCFYYVMYSRIQDEDSNMSCIPILDPKE